MNHNRSRARFLGLMIVLVLAVSACSGDAESGAETDRGDADPAPADEDNTDASEAGNSSSDESQLAPAVDIETEFEPAECAADLPVDPLPVCGVVRVPMDWTTGDGEVELAVALFESTSETPELDPVVYLEGGPGGHALETLQFSAEDLVVPLLERSDVIVFDQRGAGLSVPRLDCSEVEALSRDLEDTPFVDDDVADKQFVEALTSCRSRLLSDGIDLQDFNSINNAHDVDAIRKALGYEQWNLFGISYGTKLGLEVMRQHPDGVRSAVLDSVYPPEVDSVAENPLTFTESFENVVAACAAEPECAAEGDLGERLASLAGELQESPKRIEARDWIAGDSDEIYLTGDTLVAMVTQSLYSPSWFSDLPELATDLEAGRTEVVETFAGQIRSTERFFTDGMFFAIACNEEISFADPAEVTDPPDPFGLRDTFQLASNTGTKAFLTCDAFENGQAPASSNQPVASDLPTLLMAGYFDPVTPISWAESAAASLTNSYLVVGPHQSHGVSGGECGIGIVSAFFDDPSAMPDSSCLDDEEVRFLAADPDGVELESFSFDVAELGLTISTVRPTDWTTGALDGDQYRRQSFLDPTQLYQLAGGPELGAGLAGFIEDTWQVDLTEPTAFDGTAGSTLSASQLDRAWQRRVGRSDATAVEWFETLAGDGVQIYVILVSAPSELDANLEQIVLPALTTIQAE